MKSEVLIQYKYNLAIPSQKCDFLKMLTCSFHKKGEINKMRPLKPKKSVEGISRAKMFLQSPRKRHLQRAS